MLIGFQGNPGSVLGAIIDPASMTGGPSKSGGNQTGGNGALSDTAIAQVAFQAGFHGQGLRTAIAVALAESGGNPSAHNQNSNGSIDRGLWQINSVHVQYDPIKLFDPAYNAQAAFQISSGGNNWNPWTTYTNGRYRTFVSRANSAAVSIEAGVNAL